MKIDWYTALARETQLTAPAWEHDQSLAPPRSRHSRRHSPRALRRGSCWRCCKGSARAGLLQGLHGEKEAGGGVVRAGGGCWRRVLAAGSFVLAAGSFVLAAGAGGDPAQTRSCAVALTLAGLLRGAAARGCCAGLLRGAGWGWGCGANAGGATGAAACVACNALPSLPSAGGRIAQGNGRGSSRGARHESFSSPAR